MSRTDGDTTPKSTSPVERSFSQPTRPGDTHALPGNAAGGAYQSMHGQVYDRNHASKSFAELRKPNDKSDSNSPLPNLFIDMAKQLFQGQNVAESKKRGDQSSPYKPPEKVDGPVSEGGQKSTIHAIGRAYDHRQGGSNDIEGRPIYTLEDQREGRAPYTTLAGSPNDHVKDGQLFTIDQYPGMKFRMMDIGGAYKGRELYDQQGDPKANPRAGVDMATRPGGQDLVKRHLTMHEINESDADRTRAAGGVDHGYRDDETRAKQEKQQKRHQK